MRTVVTALAVVIVTACSGTDDVGPHSVDDSHLDAGQSPHELLDCPAEAFAAVKLNVGEVQLNVACRGSGRTALLLHGYPEFHGTWDAVAVHLVAAGYRVVAPDLRGYNLSDRPDALDAYHVDHLVTDVIGLIETVNSGQVVLVAHDWGGVLAWLLAHRRPDLVARLIVLNGPHPDIWGRPDVDAVQAKATDSYVPLIANGTLGPSVIEPMIAGFLSEDELAAYRASWEQPGAIAAMSNWFGANIYPDNRLPTGISVDIPTLVLWGMSDTFVTSSELEVLPRYVRDLEIVRLEGVGHWVPQQAPDRVAMEIARFAAAN